MDTETKSYVDEALEALNDAGLDAYWSHTGGNCYAIQIDFGDPADDDWRQILITGGGENGDVFYEGDIDDNETFDGLFFVGAYDRDAQMINEDGEITTADVQELVAAVLASAKKHYGFTPKEA